MDKLKAFFSNKITRIVSWVLLIICSVILIIGGTTADDISNVVILLIGSINALASMIAFIGTLVKKE